jgi:hypothetical protein
MTAAMIQAPADRHGVPGLHFNLRRIPRRDYKADLGVTIGEGEQIMMLQFDGDGNMEETTVSDVEAEYLFLTETRADELEKRIEGVWRAWRDSNHKRTATDP